MAADAIAISPTILTYLEWPTQLRGVEESEIQPAERSMNGRLPVNRIDSLCAIVSTWIESCRFRRFSRIFAMLTTRKSFFAILLLGLAIRLWLCISYPQDLTSDNDGYLAHARVVASGEGFAGPSTHRPTAFRPPAYPVALGLQMKLGCSDSLSVVTINMVSSAVILCLTLTLAMQSGLPVIPALCAVCAAAFDPLLVRYSSLPMTEVPCAAMLLAAVVCYLSSQRHLIATRAPATLPGSRQGLTRMFVVSGILFGLGSLVRPVVLVSCAFLTGFAAGTTFRSESKTRHPRFLPPFAPPGFRLTAYRFSVLVPAVVAALTITPWIIRNAITFGDFIPVTTHGGYTLALGNNAAFYRDVINGADEFPWDGESLDAWQQLMIAESVSDGVALGDEPAQDAWYYQQAVAAIRAEPRSFLKATALRLQRFWAISAADTQTSPMMKRAVSLWYGLLWTGLVLQVIGCWFRRKSKQSVGLTDLWLVVLSFLLMHSVYWTDTRMRAPVMPILCVLSVAGWSVATDFAKSLLIRRKDAQP